MAMQRVERIRWLAARHTLAGSDDARLLLVCVLLEISRRFLLRHSLLGEQLGLRGGQEGVSIRPRHAAYSLPPVPEMHTCGTPRWRFGYSRAELHVEEAANLLRGCMFRAAKCHVSSAALRRCCLVAERAAHELACGCGRCSNSG